MLSVICSAVVNAEEQTLSNHEKSIVFLLVAAERGHACGLVSEWQSAAIMAQALDDAARRESTRLPAVSAQVMAESTQTGCDDPAMNTWIDAARKGFESEFLPPYLVIYRAIARLDDRPKVFDAVALRHDHQPVIDAITAKLAQLEASGAVAEGGKPWPDYIAGIENRLSGISDILRGDATDGGVGPDQAAAYLAQAAYITELWYEEEIANEGAQSE